MKDLVSSYCGGEFNDWVRCSLLFAKLISNSVASHFKTAPRLLLSGLTREDNKILCNVSATFYGWPCCNSSEQVSVKITGIKSEFIGGHSGSPPITKLEVSWRWEHHQENLPGDHQQVKLGKCIIDLTRKKGRTWSGTAGFKDKEAPPKQYRGGKAGKNK